MILSFTGLGGWRLVARNSVGLENVQIWALIKAEYGKYNVRKADSILITLIIVLCSVFFPLICGTFRRVN